MNQLRTSANKEVSDVDCFNVLDLFSGTGELGLRFSNALEARGIRCRTIAYCDNNRYSQSMLFSRMERGEIDTAPVCDDVNDITGEEFERVDAIIGGFPCQDISTAGRGEGLDGDRSILFFQITRLARVLRPTLIGLENVSAILIRGGGRVISELASLNYDVRATTLSAAEVGATHRRNRWWCLAYSGHRSGRAIWEAPQGGDPSALGPAHHHAAGGPGRHVADRHRDGHPLLREAGCGEDGRVLGQDAPGEGGGLVDAQGRRIGRILGELRGEDGGQVSGMLRESDCSGEGSGVGLAHADRLGRPHGELEIQPAEGGVDALGDPAAVGGEDPLAHAPGRGRRVKGSPSRCGGERDGGQPGEQGEVLGHPEGDGDRPGLCQAQGRPAETRGGCDNPVSEVGNPGEQRQQEREHHATEQEPHQGLSGLCEPTVGLADSHETGRAERCSGLAVREENSAAECGGRFAGLPARPPAPNDARAWAEILKRFPEVKPAFRGVVAGMSYRNDRIRACGNGVDGPCAESAYKILLGL